MGFLPFRTLLRFTAVTNPPNPEQPAEAVSLDRLLVMPEVYDPDLLPCDMSRSSAAPAQTSTPSERDPPPRTSDDYNSTGTFPRLIGSLFRRCARSTARCRDATWSRRCQESFGRGWERAGRCLSGSWDSPTIFSDLTEPLLGSLTGDFAGLDIAGPGTGGPCAAGRGTTNLGGHSARAGRGDFGDVAAEVGQHFAAAGGMEAHRPLRHLRPPSDGAVHRRLGTGGVEAAWGTARTIFETTISRVPLGDNAARPRFRGGDEISNSLVLGRVFAAVFNQVVVPKIGLSRAPDQALYMRLRAVIDALFRV